MAQAALSPRAVLGAAALVVGGSAGVQVSAALSSRLFSAYGSFAVSGMRMAIAAVVLLAVIRPRLRGRGPGEWLGIGLYGAAMAVMNLSLYAAIDRIPLGIAVTLEFLGPCAVALAATRRLREAGVALLALAGVALISAGPLGYFDAAGYAAALCAAAAFGGYTLLAARVGKAGSGLDGLALSVGIAAALTLPLAAPHVGEVKPADLGLLAVCAVVGVAIPCSLDTLAGRLSSARVIGTLFAVDPAMGALVGFALLGERLSPAALAGVLLVAVSGALVVWVSAGGAGEADGGSAANEGGAAGQGAAEGTGAGGDAARGGPAGSPPPADPAL
ncbi:EamA family transporter [Brevibacterium sp. BRM-1]|uniref:EamA family transporter n=1 Tax=Brevibacterium sp. BRM-1 TaxID=2999062 RepID=UPI00227F8B64|nr:EamA family transporter [Brevibacterium sp. BRM-1]WAL40049.1 EamA family transporter [Brevibacterium sp. BRM-1]